MVAGSIKWLVVLLCVILLQQPLNAESQFQWKFQKGAVLHQRLAMDQAIAVKMPGQEAWSETKINQLMSLELACDDVTADGIATVGQKLTHIEATFEFPAPLSKTIKFDSDKEPTGNDPLLANLEKSLRPMVGLSWVMSIDKRGAISKVTIPPGFVESLKKNGLATAGGDMFSEEGLKRMSEQSSIQFPAQELKINDTFSQPIDLKTPIGTMKMVRECQYVGIDQESGKDRFHVKVSVKLEADPKAVAQVTLKSGAGEGVILFDTDKGQLHESHISTVMEMLTLAGGQKIEQKITSTVKMNIVSDAAEESDASGESDDPGMK